MSTLLRLKDGTEVTEVPHEWTDVINLVGAKLVTNDKDVIARLKDAPFKIGDCPIDAWQGAYWMFKQSYLFGDVPVTKYKFNGPAIVVGSGPSLDLYVDKIKGWKGHALIVCAHSTANLLLQRGIEPDIVTPIERVNTNIPGVKGRLFIEQIPLPNTACAGLPVVPNEHLRYGRRMLLCSMDPIYKWIGCGDSQVFIGSYSGSAALGVAKTIASGPIYLVGNDLVGGHCSGYSLAEEPYPVTEKTMCIDGVCRSVNRIRHRVAIELGLMAKGREVYQCAPEGACIQWAPFAKLPEASITGSTLSCEGSINSDLVARVNRLRDGFAGQLDKSVKRAWSISSLKDMHCGMLFDDEYQGLAAYIFRSLFAQMSMECRFGMRHEDVLAWSKEAFRNIVEGIIGGADVVRAA